MAQKTATRKTAKKKKATPLKKFLVLYHSPASAMKKMMTATPEEKVAGMQQWMKWGQKCGSHLAQRQRAAASVAPRQARILP